MKEPQAEMDRILEAIREVAAEKRVLTPDLGGSARTHEVGDAVKEKIFARSEK